MNILNRGIKSVDDFFDYYRMDDFYDWQKNHSDAPVEPFNRNRHKKLSFGIIPGFRNYDLFYERYLSAVKILKENGFVKENIKVLDIGSGEGFFKFFFDALCQEEIEWHGIEVWKERAALCRHLGYTIQEETLEKGSLPFEDNAFDIVLASHVIEHLPNPNQIVAEMGRVAKKGAAVVIGTPTKLPGIAQLDSLYHNLSNRSTGDTQQAFTHKSLQKMILKALKADKTQLIDKRGFRIVSGRKKLPLENLKCFHDMSLFLGKHCQFCVPEVNVIVQN